MTRPPFLKAQWRHLAMVSYEVDRTALVGLVPRGTELDDWQGNTYLSVVAFLFLDTRVLGLPIPFHRDFEEVNLRFYVRRSIHGERRRGVVFIRELVPLRAVAWTARALYGERYGTAVIRHRHAQDDGKRSVVYEWQRDAARGRISLTASGEPSALVAGSEEEFIADHAWGYVAREGRTTLEYRVDHPRWRIWRVASPEFECDSEAFYGRAWAPILARPPVSAFLAEGSEIARRRGRGIDA